MKVKKSHFYLALTALAICIALPVGYAFSLDDDTFRTVVIVTCIVLIVLAFAFPLYALWKQNEKIKKEKKQ